MTPEQIRLVQFSKRINELEGLVQRLKHNLKQLEEENKKLKTKTK